MPQVLLKGSNWTKDVVPQVELDGILSESNKLSKDIGEMMKAERNQKPQYLKRKQFH
jgi:hypothetical protein